MSRSAFGSDVEEMTPDYLSTTVLPVQRHITSAEYQALVDRIHSIISTELPPRSVVLVASKGDERIIDLPTSRGWHFPQDPDGEYPGYYPADSDGVIEHLEDLVEKGADYLVLPSTSFWWPDHYAEFARHLAARYRVIVRLDETCLIYVLRESGDRLADFLDNLLPQSAPVAVISGRNDRLLELGRPASHLPADDADIAAALDELEDCSSRFLIVPTEASSWLLANPEFLTEVRSRFREIANRPTLCSVFDLERPAAPVAEGGRTDPKGDEKALRGPGLGVKVKQALRRRARARGESRGQLSNSSQHG